MCLVADADVTYVAAATGCAQRAGRLLHRLDDVLVAGAPAQVAGEPLADVGLARRRRCASAARTPSAACRACRSRTAGRADPRSPAGARAACRPCASPSTVRISWPSACAANIEQDLTARVAVHDDDAAAAARRVAADVGAGQPAVFPQEIREQRARLDVPLVADAVDLDVDLHACTPRRANA